jgi:hypothetical protein
MATFRLRDELIEAMRMRVETTVDLERGKLKAEPGDWLVTFKTEEGLQGQFVFPDPHFRALFEPVEEQGSRRAWAERFPHEIE